jgi:hypothetical protein
MVGKLRRFKMHCEDEKGITKLVLWKVFLGRNIGEYFFMRKTMLLKYVLVSMLLSIKQIHWIWIFEFVLDLLHNQNWIDVCYNGVLNEFWSKFYRVLLDRFCICKNKILKNRF